MKYLIILFLFISCGTRKVETSKKIERSSSKIETLQHKNVRVDSLYTFDLRSLILTPLDASKPMEIDGKEYKNVKIESTEKQEKGETSKVDNSKNAISEEKKEKTVAKSKKSERENNTWQTPLIILALGAIGVLYLKTR